MTHGWTRALAALVMATATAQAAAHGVWMAQRSGEMAVVYGHGAEDLDMIRRFERVREVSAFDGAGQAVKTGLRKTDHLVLVDLSEKPSVVALVLDNGFWSRQADGKWVGKGRDEIPDAKESGRFIKYAVRISGPLKAPLGPLPGQVLQIVPVKPVLPQHMNEQMTVRVLFNGKPVAGARVIRDYVTDPDAKPAITGKDGLYTFRVRNQGLNVVAASYDAPPDDPTKAARNGLHATLTFALEHGPE
jgi:nickel transport protein